MPLSPADYQPFLRPAVLDALTATEPALLDSLEADAQREIAQRLGPVFNVPLLWLLPVTHPARSGMTPVLAALVLEALHERQALPGGVVPERIRSRAAEAREVLAQLRAGTLDWQIPRAAPQDLPALPLPIQSHAKLNYH